MIAVYSHETSSSPGRENHEYIPNNWNYSSKESKPITTAALQRESKVRRTYRKRKKKKKKVGSQRCCYSERLRHDLCPTDWCGGVSSAGCHYRHRRRDHHRCRPHCYRRHPHQRGSHYNPSTIKLNFLLSTLENVLTAPLLLSVYSPSPHSAFPSAPFFSPAL